ncbi:MAG: hypothetical protein ACOYXT_13160 [Bacteroidota bacterium]
MRNLLVIVCVSFSNIVSGQKIFFHEYDLTKKTYSFVLQEGESTLRYPAIYLGGNWKVLGDKFFGSTSNAIKLYTGRDSNLASTILYSTKNFIQDFDVTAKYLFTIESSEEQYLNDDGRCLKTCLEDSKQEVLSCLNNRNLYNLRASPFSDELIVIEKNDSVVIVGVCNTEKNQYRMLEKFNIYQVDLDFHNKAVWLDKSTFSVIVRNKNQKFEVLEINTSNGSRIRIDPKVDGKIIDFDFHSGAYYFLVKEKNSVFVSTLRNSERQEIVGDNNFRVISGFEIN